MLRFADWGDKVSKGTIEWVPVNHSYGYHLTWENFDALMKGEGKK